MPNTLRTSRRPKQVQHRPAHLNRREIREAFVFWVGFEALLNLLNLCGVELFHWLREAMENELIPGLIIAVVAFLICTPASRYGLVLEAAKNYGHQFGQVRVEQILKFLTGHHMRLVLLWAGAMACMHLTGGCAKSVFLRPSDPPLVMAPVPNVSQRKTTPPTFSGASELPAPVSNDDRELKRYFQSWE